MQLRLVFHPMNADYLLTYVQHFDVVSQIVLESLVQFGLLPFLGKTETELVFQNLEILQDQTETNENWSSSVLVWFWTSLDQSGLICHSTYPLNFSS